MNFTTFFTITEADTLKGDQFDRAEYEKELAQAKADVTKVTPELMARYYDRLHAGRYNIFRISPFIGIFLRNLSVVTTTSVPTMAVDDKGNIYINPIFSMEELNFEEFVAVLAHEAMHIINLTHRRKQGREHELWNICTDLIMNRDLIGAGFKIPELALVPKDNQVKYISKTGKEVTLDITSMSAEGLYKILSRDAKRKNGNEKSGEGKPGKGTPGEGKPGKGKPGEGKPGKDKQPGSNGGSSGEKLEEPVEGTGTIQNKEGDIKSFDEQFEKGNVDVIPLDGSDTPKEVSVEDTKRRIKEASQEAAKESAYRENTQSGRGPGVTPNATAAGVIKQALLQAEPEVNWRRLLREIIVKTSSTHTMSRPHRRTYAGGAYMARKIKTEQLGFCCMAIDTSGSVSLPLVSKFVVEACGIVRAFPHIKILLCLWASEVYKHVLIDSSNVDQVASSVTSGYQYKMGTRLSNVAKWLEKSPYAHNIKGVIYFTDGCITPDDTYIMGPPVKNFALITVLGRKLGFAAKIPKMHTVVINTHI